MGQIKEKIFLQHINRSINDARATLIASHTPKRGGRFFVDGITYEISDCQFKDNLYQFEVSSKIPTDYLSINKDKESYFNNVVKVLHTLGKTPLAEKMENILHTNEEELKERDYVNLTFGLPEGQLYTAEEIRELQRKYQESDEPIPNIPGVATDAGKLVILTISSTMKNLALDTMASFIEANNQVKAKFNKSTKKAKAS